MRVLRAGVRHARVRAPARGKESSRRTSARREFPEFGGSARDTRAIYSVSRIERRALSHLRMIDVSKAGMI